MSVLLIPIDASQLPEQDRKQQRIKVAIQQGGAVKSVVVSLEGGKAEVKLEADPKQAVSVAVGPESASDEDIFHLQTLTASVSPKQWTAGKPLSLAPIAVTPAWWSRWLLWCREFVVTGRLVCADGTPVPAAEVRAYDVDYFWWWSSVSQVGPAAITDASGHFTIRFRWCCGWWPWWWWLLREWRLEPLLVEKIQPVASLNPALRLPAPHPVPSFDFAVAGAQQPAAPAVRLPASLTAQRRLDPSVLPALRERLTSQLPHVPELERLRIWPWYPWSPWFDCAPDLIFRATQACGGGPAKVVLAETIFQTRFDVPTHLDVTLVANHDACCLPPPQPDPEGDCFVFTGVCGDPGIPVTQIGRTGATAGYADPGGRDRPFAESISLGGQFGTSAQADFYEIEYRPHTSTGTGAWTPVPATALADMTRGYFDATQPPGPGQFVYTPFQVQQAGGKNFYESRHHYEASHPPANWGSALTGRSWFYNVNQAAALETAGTIGDGPYDFRIVGYKALAAGGPDLASRKVMDGCGGSPDNNLLMLFLDNRTPAHPTPVPGTVHVNTTEPDCGFGINAVRLGGAAVPPCGSHQLQPSIPPTPLEVDFFVTDPDGHLDHYELVVLYDLGSIKNLLSTADVGPFTLSALSGGPVGPDYGTAVTPATRPLWSGGTFRLHIADATQVFPKTCCYLLQLTVWKRNIVSCSTPSYYNQMHYSFTVLR